MANDIISKAGHLINQATQSVSNEVAKAADGPISKSVDRVSHAIVDVLTEEGQTPHYHQDLDKGIKGSALQVMGAGYKTGAKAAQAYEQGVKYLFGRGQRHGSFKPDIAADKVLRYYGADGYQKELHLEHGGPPLDAEAKLARRIHNGRVLKQDGIFGYAAKFTIVGIGSLIGAAFCGSEASHAQLHESLTNTAHTINAGLRTLLVSVPMVAAVAVGTLVGVGAGLGVAAWQGGARAWHNRNANAAGANEAETSKTTDATSTDAPADAAGTATEDTTSEETASRAAPGAAEPGAASSEAPGAAAPEAASSAAPGPSAAPEAASSAAPGASAAGAASREAPGAAPEAAAPEAASGAAPGAAAPQASSAAPAGSANVPPSATHPAAEAEAASDDEFFDASQTTVDEAKQHIEEFLTYMRPFPTEGGDLQELDTSRWDSNVPPAKVDEFRAKLNAVLEASTFSQLETEQQAAAIAADAHIKKLEARPLTVEAFIKQLDEVLVVIRPFHARGGDVLADVNKWRQELPSERVIALTEKMMELNASPVYRQLTDAQQEVFSKVLTHVENLPL